MNETTAQTHTKIPKIIHQMYWDFTHSNPPRNMPDEWASYHQKIKEMHPTFEVILWDRPRIKQLLSEHLTYSQLEIVFGGGGFTPLPDVMISDLARLILLYHVGGFYLDLDINLDRGLQSITDSDIEVVFFAVSARGCCNAAMGTMQFSDVFRNLVKRALEKLEKVSAKQTAEMSSDQYMWFVMYSWGPKFISLCVESEDTEWVRDDDVVVKDDRVMIKVTGKPVVVFPPRALLGYQLKEDYVYGRHVPTKSWLKRN